MPKLVEFHVIEDEAGERIEPTMFNPLQIVRISRFGGQCWLKTTEAISLGEGPTACYIITESYEEVKAALQQA